MMNKDRNVKLSVLDLVPVLQGKTHLESIQNSLSLARNVEQWGYERFWISEHHNTESLVSSATPLLIGYIAENTKTIRVGSGGVMLPNHAPLVVAEQFGTLATLYPNRIDLGLGRAPGTDQRTARALRRERVESVHDFPRDIQELQHYFSQASIDGPVRAIPGVGLEVPIYILGSSTFSAQLAAQMGLPYAFASHFAPNLLIEALDIYQNQFKISSQLANPYSMAAVNVIIGDTNEEAEKLATSMKMFFLNVVRRDRNPLLPPTDRMDEVWNPLEKAQVEQMLYFSFVGDKEKVENQLRGFVRQTGVDELIVVSYIYDHNKRLKSYQSLSELNI